MKTLLFSMFLLAWVETVGQNKVGINTENPNQALDVDGKIKIGTDGRTPTEGTIGYFLGDFQGYTQEGYKSFTNKNGPLPTNPVPLSGYSPNISAGFVQFCSLYTWDGTEYTTVPNGKRFIITGLYPAASNPSSANQYYNLQFTASLNNVVINYSQIRISGYDNDGRSFSGDAAPLLVLNEGERLRAFGLFDSTLTMNVAIRGFMVDDLSYD